MHKTLNRIIAPYLLVLPAFLVFTLVIIVPMMEGIWISLTDWDGVYSIPNFVGLDNYIAFFQDYKFYDVIKITLVMTVLIVILQNITALFLSVMLEKNSTANNILRSVFFIPSLLTTIVVGLIFSYIFSTNFGIINILADKIGFKALASVDWLGDATLALLTVVFTTVWQFAGYNMIMYIGALKNIPLEFYESANIDGASMWKKFLNITLPLVAPALTINVLITLIGCLKFFDIPYVMTRGGPAGATRTIAIMLYEDAFYSHNAGYASAEAFILLIFVFVFSIIQVKFFRSREVNM